MTGERGSARAVGGRLRAEQRRLRAGFERAADDLGSVLDPCQQPVADRLALLGAGLGPARRRLRRPPRGLYLHGRVGRGKTWLADTLLAQLPGEGVLRLHAYEAARRLHAEVARQAGPPGSVDRAVAALLDGVRLVLLDELHAHDPGDAMLLFRLVRAVADRRAVLLATSNYPPPGLLPDPRHHDLVLPLVGLLQQECDVLELAGELDHRAQGHGGARPGWSSGAWLVPGSAAQLAALGLPAPQPGDRVRLEVGGRPLAALAVDGPHVLLAFDDLCGGRTSASDALELAARFRTVVVMGVPALSSVPLDAARRFADLVDVLWDRDVRLVVTAAAAPDQVLPCGVTDAARLVSRVRLLGTG